MSETDEMREILLDLGRGTTRVFRNNSGIGWAGTLIKKSSGRTGFTVTLANARPLHAGLCKGSSDIIGWNSMLILPEHVGCTVAVFLAPEIKFGRRGETEEQERFRMAVAKAGGIAFVAHSVEEARAYLSSWKPPRY